MSIIDSPRCDNLLYNPDPQRPLALLKRCPAYEALSQASYQETACLNLHDEKVGDFFLKDETERMGLGSFKALGGIYAVARCIAELWETQTGQALLPENYLDAEVQSFAKTLTFICASAGNHGVSIATGAKIFGANARIHLAETVPIEFENKLRNISADVIRSGAFYDDSVAAAISDALNTSGILLADGSWLGYTKLPGYVMEGYTVMAEELRGYFEETSSWPSHVFLQAGVGGMASAVAYMIRKNWQQQPKIIIVEPDAAPCLKQSAKAGKMTRADGPVSNMGRLDCKDPSLIAFDTLENCDVSYMTISDNEASVAVSDLKSKGVLTTPSGAAGFAGLMKYASLEGLSKSNKSLVFATEGQL